jgi:hypothetical protein
MPDLSHRIVAALENPTYKWRTIAGLAKELGVPTGVVAEFLLRHDDIVLRSRLPRKDGEPLFTTRKHYLRHTSPAQKFLAGLTNRIQ